MKNVNSVDYVIDALQVLADNPYSLLWDLTNDFECNGHVISVKKSTQFKSVIIDGQYYSIGDHISITANGITYKPLDYVRHILSENKGVNEMAAFNVKNVSEVREAIASMSVNRVNEDKTIRIFSKGSHEYEKLSTAATMMSLFTGNDYYVGETYFDYGQDWKWTTILKKHPSFGAVQVLTPRDQEDILTSFCGIELGKVVDKVISK